MKHQGRGNKGRAHKACLLKVEEGMDKGGKSTKTMKDFNGEDFKKPEVMAEAYVVWSKMYQ